MDDLLRVKDLSIRFRLEGGAHDVVRDLSFRIPRGKTVALVGESGSGKSVTARALMGLLPAAAEITSGAIHFAEKPGGGAIDIARLARDGRAMRRLRGRAISMIFQEPMTSLSPVHTIGDQIGEALHLHRRLDRAAGAAIVREMLRAVGFGDPARACRAYPFELSGGLRQRAMIAMALVCRPALLIADEPTTALDVTIQAQILKLMHDLQRELGMAMLMITHDLGIVANMADEIVVMHHGAVMESGTAADIFQHPQHPYLRALLRAVPRFGMRPGERLAPIREIQPGESRLFARKPAWPEGADAAGPLLAVRQLGKSFAIRGGGLFGKAKLGAVKVIQDVDFSIARGECLGLVGESGCGKTTLSKIVMRALEPDGGEIRFNDRGRLLDVRALSGAALRRYRQRVQFVFQDPFGSLNPRMTVFDILSEPLVIHGIGSPQSRAAMVKELMRLVGLDIRHLRRYPHSFSGGQRQRIGIARALALQPDLLILDEPVSALDVSIQAQILNLLKDLQERLGLTYLFISHNLAVVDYIADRIMVMCAGRIVETAPAATLFANPVHPYTRALLAAVPDPSLARKLDFAKIVEGKTSLPAAWPPPFTVAAGACPHLVHLGDGHWVRACEPLSAAA